MRRPPFQLVKEENPDCNWFGTRGCASKIRFEDLESAQNKARALEQKYPLTEMDCYRCDAHNCWHVSHKIDFIYKKRRDFEASFIEICNLLSA